jgi:hypothetical protein
MHSRGPTLAARGEPGRETGGQEFSSEFNPLVLRASLDFWRRFQPYLIQIWPDAWAMLPPYSWKFYNLMKLTLKITFEEACKDSFVRDLNHYLPNGWEGGARGNFATAQASAVWESRVAGISRNLGEDSGRSRLAKAVWHSLEELSPPIGWLPESVDDPLITATFDRGWPRGGIEA